MDSLKKIEVESARSKAKESSNPNNADSAYDSVSNATTAESQPNNASDCIASDCISSDCNSPGCNASVSNNQSGASTSKTREGNENANADADNDSSAGLDGNSNYCPCNDSASLGNQRPEAPNGANYSLQDEVDSAQQDVSGLPDDSGMQSEGNGIVEEQNDPAQPDQLEQGSLEQPDLQNALMLQNNTSAQEDALWQSEELESGNAQEQDPLESLDLQESTIQDVALSQNDPTQQDPLEEVSSDQQEPSIQDGTMLQNDSAQQDPLEEESSDQQDPSIQDAAMLQNESFQQDPLEEESFNQLDSQDVSLLQNDAAQQDPSWQQNDLDSAPLEDQKDQQDDSILQSDDNSEQQNDSNQQDASDDLGIQADSADVEAFGVMDADVDDGLNDQNDPPSDQENNSYQQDEFEQQNVSALNDDNQQDAALDGDLVQQEPSDQQDTQFDSALDDGGFTQRDPSDPQNDSIQPVVNQDQQDELDRQENSDRQSAALADVQADLADVEAEAADLGSSSVDEPMIVDQAANDDSSAPTQNQEDQTAADQQFASSSSARDSTAAAIDPTMMSVYSMDTSNDDSSTSGYNGGNMEPLAEEANANASENRCGECGGELTREDQRTIYRQVAYHPKCFTCAECKSEKLSGLNGFYINGGKRYCVDCYNKNVAERCTSCSEAILEGGVRHRSRPFHHKCFKCAGCETVLGRTPFVFRDNKTLCLPCYTDKFAEKCSNCSKSIQPGEQYLQVEGKRFHEECLTCDICADQLQDHPFVQDGTRNVCVNCSTNGMTSYKEKGAAAASTAAADAAADSPANKSDGMDLKDWIGDKSKPNEINRNSADGGVADADGGGCGCTNADDEESGASSKQGCCDNGESNFSAASDADPSSYPLQSVDNADVGSSNDVPQSGN